MKLFVLTAPLMVSVLVSCSATGTETPVLTDFESPVMLKAGDAAIRVESPGYAAPGWADLKGDGTKSLLVGQFRKGKIQAFKHLGAGQFAPGEWLQAEDEIAEVPGVW